MGVDATLFGGEAEDVAAVELGGVGGGDVVGDEDVLILEGIFARAGVDLEIFEDALSDVGDVDGAFLEVCVGDATHGFEVVLGDGVEAVLGVVLGGVDEFGDFFHEGMVFEDHLVSFEDFAFLVAGEVFEFFAEAGELLFSAL